MIFGKHGKDANVQTLGACGYYKFINCSLINILKLEKIIEAHALILMPLIGQAKALGCWSQAKHIW